MRKKQGKYVVVQMDPAYELGPPESREVYGITFEQRRNDRPVTADYFKNTVTKNKDLPESAVRDLLAAWITLQLVDILHGKSHISKK